MFDFGQAAVRWRTVGGHSRKAGEKNASVLKALYGKMSPVLHEK
jgi:hypothetical protein